ncbi:MAG: pyridoxal phosphate-dependent aminotransferase [Acidobacteria bacterium]|nr:MAG: pyridoxal phosphate-dependent aminotransferase [Acidobacteriota bacterium]
MSNHPAVLAERMSHIALSPTMKGTIAAEKLKREGIKVVDLGAGEPDFPTPKHVTEAAHRALDANFTKYTANMGTAELREAIAFRYREDYGVTYAPDEIIATAGGKQALYHAAMALFNPGDEVITHVPGWPTILEQIKLAGAVPVVVRTSAANGFSLTAELLLSAVTPKTKAIVVNSPGNPTGGLMPEDEARKLAAECAKREIWVVMDLCYEGLVYDGVPHNMPKSFEAMRDRFVICGSASKAYAMTGWRCGWVLAPKSVTSGCNALQSHETSNVNSITQKAAVAALTGSQDCVKEMRAVYKQRRDQVIEWLKEEPRMTCPVPRGAFYLFPSIEAFLSPAGFKTSQDFTDSLLATEHVIVTPAEAFEATGAFRLSYAASLETLRDGVTRIIRHARSR